MCDYLSDFKMTKPDFSKFETAARDATYVHNNFLLAGQAELLDKCKQYQKAQEAKDKHEASVTRQKYQTVSNMIKNDPAAPKNLNVDKMTNMILEAAEETGVDPVYIASIAKQETHYNQNKSGSFGKGIMQITTPPLKDMYLRPDFYDPTLKPLMRKYKNWAGIVAAKRKNPDLNLGSFGNMLYKYGSYDKLKTAIIKDPQLNLKTGAYIFRAQLNRSGGNVQRALVNYNGSSIKVKYAREVMGHIAEGKNYQQQYNRATNIVA